MNKLILIINLIYFLISLLFYLDLLTSFDIKEEHLKLFVYYSVFILIPFILFCNFKYIQFIHFKIITSLLPIISLILLLILTPIKIMFLSSSWKTQTIIYKHGHLNFKKIELQIQDKGALGYNKRIVEVLYLTKYFMITKPVDENIEKNVEWFKVDIYINELKLK